MVELLWKIVWQFLKRLNVELLHGPAVLSKRNENIHLHGNFYTDDHSYIIHKRQKAETSPKVCQLMKDK